MNHIRNNITRAQVLWCGNAPTSEVVRELENRNLLVKILLTLDELLPELLPVSCGIVLQLADRPTELLRFFNEFAQNTANHGLLHLLIATNTNELVRIRSIQPDFTKTIDRFLTKRSRDRDDFVRLIPKSNHEIAEALARWNPGPGKTNVEILGEIATEDRLFFERAFSDCQRISVTSLAGGRSGSVYCVYAHLSHSQIGPRPLPFFAKTDSLEKIERERAKYQEFVNSYVPFHLRPDLDEQRCLRGATRGMLVGDFVEKSEPLRAVAARGHAHGAIYSVFESALSGLRLQAYPVAKPLPKLWDKMDKTFSPEILEKKHQQRLAKVKEWGGAGNPSELYAQLQKHADIPTLVAPMHGDLHPYNVRVRGNDAILIDFNSMRAQMPMSADPASLEVSLVFGWGDDSEAVPEFDVWRNMVDRLYSAENLLRPPPPPDQFNEREWFWAAARQIRQIALSSQICEWEYGTVAAMYLLRHSGFENHFPNGHSRAAEDELRRSYAYLVGERIIAQLRKHAEDSRK